MAPVHVDWKKANLVTAKKTFYLYNSTCVIFVKKITIIYFIEHVFLFPRKYLLLSLSKNGKKVTYLEFFLLFCLF